MKITWDRVIGILGILVSIPAILELFHSERLREGLLLSTLAILLFGVMCYLRWLEKQPLFTYLEISKDLAFNDPAADLATFETRAKTKANHTGVQQLWFRNINADGDIRNFTVDDVAATVQRKAGSWEVCKQFDHALQRGTVVSVKLRYELHKAFCGNTEGITHVTATKTGKLTMIVRFHERRVGRNLRAFVGRGSQVEEPLNLPSTLDDGKTIELIVERPKQGSYYTIEWSW